MQARGAGLGSLGVMSADNDAPKAKEVNQCGLGGQPASSALTKVVTPRQAWQGSSDVPKAGTIVKTDNDNKGSE